MERILSQDEINALFSSMSSNDPILMASAESSGARSRQVTPYDFCRFDRLSKDQIRSLHLLHSYFARNLSTSLSAYLRAMTEVELRSIDQIPYLEFLKRVADPTLYCSLRLQPLHGNLAMEISPSITFPMIDMLLGGPGNAPSENRPLTEIETNIMDGVIRLIQKDLKEAWRSIQELEPRLEGVETKPQMLQVVAPGEAVIAVSFAVKLGSSSGTLSFAIPAMMLRLSRARFDQHWRPRPADADARESRRLRELVRGAPVTLTAEIRERDLRVEDLLSISSEDVIQLDKPVGDPILLCVGGVPKFKGRIIVRRGKRGLEITEKYES